MAFLSDRAQKRGPFVGGLLLLALVGFIIAIASDKPGAKYAGVFIAASGIPLHISTYPRYIACLPRCRIVVGKQSCWKL
jgi:hypothetical protein